MKEKIFFDYLEQWFINLWHQRSVYLEKLETMKELDVVKVITWIRRVWKSVILKQFISSLLKKWINIEQVFYLHLDDYRLGDNFDIEWLWSLFDYYLQNIYTNWTIYVFLDEIQNIKTWERFVRTVNEKYWKKINIFLTWSNSNLLSGELSTLLTWRFIEIEVYPLSFKEFLEFKNIKLDSNYDTQKLYLFKEYLEFWWLPEVVNIENIEMKENYLLTLIDSILFKDIILRYNLRKTNFLSSLLKFIYSTTSSLFSINSILKYLKQDIKKLDYETVDNYLWYLNNSFLINKLENYSYKTKDILKWHFKYYSYDLWLRNIFSRNDDIWKKLENYIFLELKRRWYNLTLINDNKSEIDFFAEKQNKKLYVQVSYSLENKDVYKREITPLVIKKDNYSKIILTLDEWIKDDNWIYIKNIIDWSLK